MISVSYTGFVAIRFTPTFGKFHCRWNRLRFNYNKAPRSRLQTKFSGALTKQNKARKLRPRVRRGLMPTGLHAVAYDLTTGIFAPTSVEPLNTPLIPGSA